MTDIIEPPASKLWVFADEHPDSINDGWMVTDVDDRSHWCDRPASYHNGACGFGFADGHAETHQWLEPSTRVKVTKRWPPPSIVRSGASIAKWSGGSRMSSKPRIKGWEPGRRLKYEPVVVVRPRIRRGQASRPDLENAVSTPGPSVRRLSGDFPWP